MLFAFQTDAIRNTLGLTPATFTLGVVIILFLMLAFTSLAPDLILMSGVLALLFVGVLTPADALAGLSNEAMVTVAVLYVVGAGVQETGGVDAIAKFMFGRPRSLLGAIFRVVFPNIGLSGFMNNTPLVAMMIPAVSDFAKTQRIAASKLLLPLSYAAILGGTMTLIGTSTNMVVQGMLVKKAAEQRTVQQAGQAIDEKAKVAALSMFTISWVGVPAALLGGIYVVFAARYWLPDRRPALSTTDDPKEYTVEMQVESDSPLVGKSIESAGLRHLPGLFLAEIDRDGSSIPAVSPRETLRAGDRLLFVGVVESIVELQRIRGLVPAADDVFHLKAPRPHALSDRGGRQQHLPADRHDDSRFAFSQPLQRRGGRCRPQRRAAAPENRRHRAARRRRADGRSASVVCRPAARQPRFFPGQQNRRIDAAAARAGARGRRPVGGDGGCRFRQGFGRRRSQRSTAAAAIGRSISTDSDFFGGRAGRGAHAGYALRLDRTGPQEHRLAGAAGDRCPSFALGTALDKSGAADMIADSTTLAVRNNPWLALGFIYFVTLVVTELITNNGRGRPDVSVRPHHG